MVRLDLVRREHLQRLPALVGRERDGIAERPRGAHLLRARLLKVERENRTSRAVTARESVFYGIWSIGSDIACELDDYGARAEDLRLVSLEAKAGHAELTGRLLRCGQ